jgi:hypothetical protein
MSPNPNPNPERSYWLDRPGSVDKVFWALVAACALLLLADFIHAKEAHSEIESLFGFYAWYGFFCCVGLVLAAKELRRLLMRGEKYYGSE